MTSDQARYKYLLTHRTNMNWKNGKLVYVAKIDNLRYDCQFVATNDEVVWKDTPDQKSINAAFKNKEDMAETVPYDQVKHVSWTAIEVMPDCYARFKNAETYQVGDTPHEAATYLEFDESYNIEREPITEEDNIQDQAVDILRKLHGSVHYETVPKYLNYEKIPYSRSELTSNQIRQDLKSFESDTSIYRTKNGDEWWSAR